MKYPFEPRSTAHLLPGQFWAIPLEAAQFACGRVLQLVERAGKRDPRIFLAGISSWFGTTEPTEAAIAGYLVIEQGQLHVKSIRESGRMLLGLRELSADGIGPGYFLDQAGGATCMVLRGTAPIRPASAADIRLIPVLRTWGYDVPTILARKYRRTV